MSRRSDLASLNDPAAPDNAAASELSAVVDELLNQLSNKFSKISSELVAKMDDMSRRLDNLEATIQAQANDNRKSRPEGDSK